MTDRRGHETISLTEAAEYGPAGEVYTAVMERALPLMPAGLRQLLRDRGVPLDAEPSPLLARMDEVLGTTSDEAICVERLPIDAGGNAVGVVNLTVLPTGAYKGPGLTHSVLAAYERNPNLKGATITSAGNAADGAWLACSALGIPLVAFCTDAASEFKVDKLQAKGVDVRRAGQRFTDVRGVTEAFGEKMDYVVLDAYDDLDTIAGHTWIAWGVFGRLMELADQGFIDPKETPLTLKLPVGGGGLIAAFATVARWLKDQGVFGENNLQVDGVQLEGCDAGARYRQYVEEHNGQTPPPDFDLFGYGMPFNSLTDGAAVERPGDLTAAVFCDPRFVRRIDVVAVGPLGMAVEALTDFHGVRVEPTAGLSLAGVGRACDEGSAGLVLTFTTGANVSDEAYKGLARRTAVHREEAARLAALVAGYKLGGYRPNASGRLVPPPGGVSPVSGSRGVAGRTRVISAKLSA